jgi:hypothetical protein
MAVSHQRLPILKSKAKGNVNLVRNSAPSNLKTELGWSYLLCGKIKVWAGKYKALLNGENRVDG